MKKIYLFASFILFSCLWAQAQIITTIAGTGTMGYSGDGGQATNALINLSFGLALDNRGDVYFTDYTNHRVREINASGYMSTIAGNGTGGYTGDGIAATSAEIYHPYGLAVDTGNNVYIGDQGNSRVRMVSAAGIIFTIAGNGALGYSGDGGPATDAVLYYPDGVAVDIFENIYVGDAENYRIRKVLASSDTIITVAGNGIAGYSGDGFSATSAEINGVCATVDGSGNIYIADVENHRVRKVSDDGIITTIAGTGVVSSSGDGGPATNAEFETPLFVAIDNIGNIYISDENANRVRKIDRYGIINTIAGTGVAGYNGDGIVATSAQLNGPNGIAIDSLGNVYIADGNNYRIRKISYGNHPPSFAGGHYQALTVCADDTSSIDSLMSITDADTGQTETWTLMAGPYHGTAAAALATTSTGGLIVPSGLSYTPAPGYIGADTFTVRIDDGFSVYYTTVYVTVSDCALETGVVHPHGQALLFPNPASEMLSVKTEQGTYSAYTIHNMVGQQVMTGALDAPQANLAIGSLPPGIYYIILSGSNGNTVMKFARE